MLQKVILIFIIPMPLRQSTPLLPLGMLSPRVHIVESSTCAKINDLRSQWQQQRRLSTDTHLQLCEGCKLFTIHVQLFMCLAPFLFRVFDFVFLIV